MDDILLQKFNNEVEARILKAMLEERGIEAFIRSSSLHTTLPMLQLSYDLYIPEQSTEIGNIVLRNYHEEHELQEDTSYSDIKIYLIVIGIILFVYLSTVMGLKFW